VRPPLLGDRLDQLLQAAAVEQGRGGAGAAEKAGLGLR